MELGGGAAYWSLENGNFTGTVVREHDSELEFQDSRLPHVHKSFKFAHGWNKGIILNLLLWQVLSSMLETLLKLSNTVMVVTPPWSPNMKKLQTAKGFTNQVHLRIGTC